MAATLTRRCWWALAFGTLTIAGSSEDAHADDGTGAPSLSVSVDYRAPATCPSRDEFIANVRRYTTKWRLVDAGPANRAFIVRFDGTVGSLDVIAGERKIHRVVTGPSCSMAARGLAVMVALVIDPMASISEPPEAHGPAESPLEPEAPVSSPIEPDAPSAPSSRSEGRARPRRPPSRRVAPPARATGHFSFELRQELSTAVTERSLMVFGAFAGYELPSWADLGARTGIAALGPPSLALGVRQSLPRAIGVSGGSSVFTWSVATARACPLLFRLAADRVHVAPCVEGSTGALRTESEGIRLAQETTKRWFDVSTALSGTWRVMGPLMATFSASLVVPLTRHRFEVAELASLQPGRALRTELVSQAPPVGVAGGVGLGLVF